MSTTDPNTPPNPKQLFGDKKPPLDEFPLSAMILASLAGLDGDNKYGFRNWRDLDVEARTYAKAAIRHIRLWEEGEEYTRDTSADVMNGPGVHNLGAAIAGLAILIDAQVNGTLIDNRVKSPAVCDLMHKAEESVAFLNELQAERNRKKATPEIPIPMPGEIVEREPEDDGDRTIFPKVMMPRIDPDKDAEARRVVEQSIFPYPKTRDEFGTARGR